MSEAMKMTGKLPVIREESSGNESGHVVVVYDDRVARTQALAVCDVLVRQVWGAVNLEFHWWRTDFLTDAIMSEQAAEDGVKADFLVLCAGSEHQLSTALQDWFERWLGRRQEREGILVDVGAITAERIAPSSARRRELLRRLCRRGHFDYLAAYDSVSSPIPGADGEAASLGPTIERVLGGIRPPSHFGLNE